MIDRVIGNYRIVEKVGEGGMGTVYRAVDLMLEREVAIKAIRPELSREPEIVERFRAEAKMLARLSHPAIATIYSFFVEGEDLFLAMEFVRGSSLSHLLQSAGPLPWERAVPLLAGALDGIDQAHRVGIVHRDLKSDNLMVSESGTVKVMDFGIARLIGSSRLTRTGLLVGTLHYMAPEQIRGEEVDRRTDIYALGAVLYEMLTGRVPFQGASDYAVLKAHVEEDPAPPSAAMPGLPSWLDQAILKALAKAPAERFQTVEELRLFLLGGLGSPAAAGPTFVMPAADQPTLRLEPTAGTAPPPATARLPARPAPDPHAPRAPGWAAAPGSTAASGTTLAPPPRTPPPASRTPVPAAPSPVPAPVPAPARLPDQALVPPDSHPGWAGGRRPALLAGVAVAVLVAVLAAAAVLYRTRAAPPVAPPAPAAVAGGTGASGIPGGTGRSGSATASAPGATGASAPRAAIAPGAAPGTTTGRAAGSGRGNAPGGADAGPAVSPAAAASAGGEGAAAKPSPPAMPRTGGKRTGPDAGDAPPARRRTSAPAGAASNASAPAGAAEAGADTENAGGKDERAARAEGAGGQAAGGGSSASGTPDDELRQIGAELEAETDQIRNLYADFLSQKEKGGSPLTATDDKLKDELKDLQRAAEGFHVQFLTGFWARTRSRFGRLGHSEDQKAQVSRVARALLASDSRVNELMAQVKPDPAVRDLWRQIHRQCKRVSAISGL
jgi:tRNA A-37 threonylcarbamoyl transferase component Bud32